MKTAISIPNQIFNEAERYAKNNGITRSQLYSTAVSEYVHSNQLNRVTEKLNEVYSNSSAGLDETVRNLQTLSIPREKWS